MARGEAPSISGKPRAGRLLATLSTAMRVVSHGACSEAASLICCVIGGWPVP